MDGWKTYIKKWEKQRIKKIENMYLKERKGKIRGRNAIYEYIFFKGLLKRILERNIKRRNIKERKIQ